MLSFGDEENKKLENLKKKISKEKVQKNWNDYMELTPIHSGSRQEEKAVEFIVSKLQEYGLEPDVLKYNAYVSDPKLAKLEILEPQYLKINCTPYRQVGTTGEEGIEAEAIYVPPEELGTTECKDKVLIVEQKTADDWMGLRYPFTLMLQKMGVKGLIVIDQDTFIPTVIHQRADFSVSGAPIPGNIDKIQTLRASVSVSNKDGQRLKKIAGNRPLKVKLTSVVDTKWNENFLPTVQIEGKEDPEKFVLINGHIDTPPFSPGVTDNASGVVAMLEIARLLQDHKDYLKKTVKIAFWTGHEIGRYAGSTWYNDKFWHDLRYNCLVSLNIDSPGAKGATDYRPAPFSEFADLFIESIEKELGVNVGTKGWSSRSADRSFWSTGVPQAIFMPVLPKEELDPFVNISGGGWWWHTAWATIDRGDIDVLLRDIRVNLNFIYKTVNSIILPHNFCNYADEIVNILQELQNRNDKVRSYFNIYDTLDQAREFSKLIGSFKNTIKELEKNNTVKEYAEKINTCIMWVSRFINQIAHSDTDKTSQIDMATFGATPFPRIYRKFIDLADMSLHQTDDFKLLLNELVREKNFVNDGFYLSNYILHKTIDEIAD